MRKTLCTMLFSLLFIVSACGTTSDTSEDSEVSTDLASTTEVEEDINSEQIEVEDASGKVTAFESIPESVAVLSSGDLDIVQALGVNVVGRPTANGPVDTKLESIEEIGNPHQPNFEKIAEVNPDVLAASLSFKQYEENIQKQGTEIVYTEANSINDITNTITMFGEIFNKEQEATQLIQTIEEDIHGTEKVETVRALLIYGAPGTYLAALPNSLAGDLLEKAGGENIASDFPKEDRYPQYATLSSEKIIERNPEVIMLMTHGEPEAVKEAFEKEMNENANWKNLDAVKNDKVIILPSHLFGTNPGTKVTEALQVMKESLMAVD